MCLRGRTQNWAAYTRQSVGQEQGLKQSRSKHGKIEDETKEN